MADLCLVPLRAISLFDGFIPSKIFEIMAMGRPILGSLRGEAAAILSRSGSSVVVAPEDDLAIASNIMDLRLSEDRRAVMGQRGRSFVEAGYSREILAKRYLTVMSEAGARVRK
jgi:hypothetical protein